MELDDENGSSAEEPVTFDSALSQLNSQDEPSPSPEPKPEGAPEPEGEATEEPPVDGEGSETDEVADTDAEFLHGNAKTRLRDGTVITVGELKKQADQAKEYARQLQERDAQFQEFTAKQAEVAQQQQFFNQSIAQAKLVLEANFPPEPDVNLIQTDLHEYTMQKVRREQAVAQWNELNAAQEAHIQEEQSKQEEALKQHVSKELTTFFDKVPDLKDNVEAQRAFKVEVMTEVPRHYGFSQADMAGITDHRVLLALKDAIAYRKLQANKAVALEKAKDVPPVPVSAPGRRGSAGERKQATVEDGLSRVKKSGSMDDALSVLNSLD